MKRYTTHRLVMAGCVQITLLLCLLLPASGTAADVSLPDLIDRVRPSIVAIGAVYPPRQPNRRADAIVYAGTGFVVADGRHVVTNAHVVNRELDTAGGQQLAVFAGRGAEARVYPARIDRIDESRDLALLAIQGPALPALQVAADARVREGQAIAFMGFPVGDVLGLYPATHRGIISAITPVARPMENARDISAAQLRRMRDPYAVFQLDAVAYPGNSGSPLFALGTGELIGVINAVLVKESRESAISSPTGISYAIPIRFVHQLLDDR